MLTSLSIQNFRGLKHVEINPLGRVNLITGKNNTGKTALLEALYILLSQPNPGVRANLPREFRSGVGGAEENENFWKWLFYNKNQELAINLECGRGEREPFSYFIGGRINDPVSLRQVGVLGSHSCYTSLNADGDNAGIKAIHFSTRVGDPNEEARNFNRVILKRRKKDLVRILQTVEPALVDLESLHGGSNGQNSMPLIYADVGLPEMIPVSNLGQGFNRLLAVFSEVLVNDAQVLLVDEIENGIHHGLLATVWRGLFQACRTTGLQIFATTHSWECILAADQAAREATDAYDLNLIRLDRVEGDIKATVMDKETIETAQNLAWEMR